MTTPPPVDAAQARAIQSLFASFRPPYLGDAEHQPTLVFHSGTTSRVVCTCGAELGIVGHRDGMAVVVDLHKAHVARDLAS